MAAGDFLFQRLQDDFLQAILNIAPLSAMTRIPCRPFAFLQRKDTAMNRENLFNKSKEQDNNPVAMNIRPIDPPTDPFSPVTAKPVPEKTDE
jgi:hypothetical protein